MIEPAGISAVPMRSRDSSIISSEANDNIENRALTNEEIESLQSLAYIAQNQRKIGPGGGLLTSRNSVSRISMNQSVSSRESNYSSELPPNSIYYCGDVIEIPPSVAILPPRESSPEGKNMDMEAMLLKAAEWNRSRIDSLVSGVSNITPVSQLNIPSININEEAPDTINLTRSSSESVATLSRRTPFLPNPIAGRSSSNSPTAAATALRQHHHTRSGHDTSDLLKVALSSSARQNTLDTLIGNSTHLNVEIASSGSNISSLSGTPAHTSPTSALSSINIGDYSNSSIIHEQAQQELSDDNSQKSGSNFANHLNPPMPPEDAGEKILGGVLNVPHSMLLQRRTSTRSMGSIEGNRSGCWSASSDSVLFHPDPDNNESQPALCRCGTTEDYDPAPPLAADEVALALQYHAQYMAHAANISSSPDLFAISISSNPQLQDENDSVNYSNILMPQKDDNGKDSNWDVGMNVDEFGSSKIHETKKNHNNSLVDHQINDEPSNSEVNNDKPTVLAPLIVKKPPSPPSSIPLIPPYKGVRKGVVQGNSTTVAKEQPPL